MPSTLEHRLVPHGGREEAATTEILGIVVALASEATLYP